MTCRGKSSVHPVHHSELHRLLYDWRPSAYGSTVMIVWHVHSRVLVKTTKHKDAYFLKDAERLVRILDGCHKKSWPSFAFISSCHFWPRHIHFDLFDSDIIAQWDSLDGQWPSCRRRHGGCDNYVTSCESSVSQRSLCRYQKLPSWTLNSDPSLSSRPLQHNESHQFSHNMSRWWVVIALKGHVACRTCMN